jgi:hypothetical protein
MFLRLRGMSIKFEYLSSAQCPLPTVHYLLSTIYCPPLLPTVYCPLFNVHYLLPTIYCPLFTAHFLLTTTVSDSERPDISGPIQSIKMYSCIQCAM